MTTLENQPQVGQTCARWRFLQIPRHRVLAISREWCNHDGRKWSMYENPQTPGLDVEAACVRYIDELKRAWSPAAQTPPTDADRKAILAMDGKRFE